MKAVLLLTIIITLLKVNSYSSNYLLNGSAGFNSEDEADTSLARKFFDGGNDFIVKLKYDSAIVFLGEAKMIYEKENLWESYFNCINIIASVLREKGEIDSSIVTLESVLDSVKEKLGEDNLTYAKTKNLLGYNYMIKNNLEDALNAATQSLNIQLNNKNNEEAADTYYLMGMIYLKRGNYDLSLQSLSEAINNHNKETQRQLLGNIYNSLGELHSEKKDKDKAIEYRKLTLEIKLEELGEVHPETAVAYNNLAVEYFYNEDYDAALEYYLKALSIDRQVKEPGEFSMGLRYNNLAMVYRVMGNFEESLKYSGESKNILINSLGEKHPQVAITINNTGRTYSDLGDFNKAIELYQQALSILSEGLGENHPFVAQCYSNLGEAFGNNGNYSTAIGMLNKSLSIRLPVFGEKHPKISESYERLGQVYLNMQNYDSALHSIQKSIISLTDGFENSSIYANPEPSKILWTNDLLYSLILKADAFEKRYSVSKDLSDLLSSYSSILLASQLVDKVRHSFKAEGSKLSFSKKAFTLYEKGINTSLRLFELTQNNDYKNAAFKFCEESKAAALLDAVSEVKARSFSGIPDSLLQNEKNLRVDLAYFDTQLLNEKQKKQPSADKVKELEEKYFSSHQQYLSLLENLEENYPAYYELKYKEKEISIENLQMMLNKQSVIIEYFLSDTSLYIFTLSNENIDATTIQLNTPVTEMVRQFRLSLHNLDFEKYISSASSLYNILIKPVEKTISGKENLFIIPDGMLYYLPFEALLTGSVNISDDINFSDLPYLINSFNISYLPSAAFLQEAKKKSETQLSFAGFAPVFADDASLNKKINNELLVNQLKRAVEINDKTYSELPESKREVEGVLDLFLNKNQKGINFISDEAKEEVIKSDIIIRYSFLHIATHGFINEEKPKLSGIIFTDKNNPPGEDGVLYSSEIYNLNLNADLVVLSACESGLGKIVKGEGLIGLTRGFIYSGAKNIIVSLWQVADKSTSELMIEFYRNILEGKSYSSSLREAKLKLIKEGYYSYPLEWSPFVLIGRN